MYIDSHCHLDFDILNARLDDVLLEAQQCGVTEFVVPSVRRDNFAAVINLASNHACIHFALGLHPCFITSHTDSDLVEIEQLLLSHRPCAIGEIGLDYFISDPQVERQLELLDAQLRIAKSHNLPVILHVRKAHDQMLQALKRLKFTGGGIVHAFNGSEQQAMRYIDEFGFKLGFGGAITHPRALKLRRLAMSLPLNSIVLETDSPDMPLAKQKREYNTPASVAEVAQLLRELRGENALVIKLQLRKNVTKALGLT